MFRLLHQYRRGQVALYLILVLVAISIVTLMNVNVFLTVRAKNRAMNAGDAAALAVARYQGELLNQMGQDNLEHLKAALKGDSEKCAEIMTRQMRRAFLDPLRGITIGNQAAKENGIEEEPDDSMRRILKSHVSDIRTLFEADPELYPEPWEGAWEEYAALLELELAAPLLAGPDNVEFVDARSSFPLTSQDFYNAIAGRQWCWFKFNGPELFDCDVDGLPQPDFTRLASAANCEIYPLHVAFKPLPANLATSESERAKVFRQLIVDLTGCTLQDIEHAPLLADQSQHWTFYDYRWNAWSTYDGIWFTPDDFPIAGEVKSEYDVYGAAAICRVRTYAPDIIKEATNVVNWTGAAKPFGTIQDERGDLAVVTAHERFVTDAFSDVRLVPVDAVGGRDLHTSDYDWVMHVKHHLKASPHFKRFPEPGCWYCDQLRLWDNAAFRQQGVIWLRFYGDTCVRPQGTGTQHGGTAHAH